MELVDYIDVLLIDLPSIPDYWITARLNKEFKGHASKWYTKMKEIHGRRNWPLWKIQISQKYSNGTCIWQETMSFENDKYSVDKDPYQWCLRKSKRLETIDPQMNIQMRNHKFLTQMPEELEHAVECRCNHSCTLDDISNTLQDGKNTLDIYQISAQDPLEELLNEFRERQFSTTLTSKQNQGLLKMLGKNRPEFSIGEEPLGKIRCHDMELYLDVERPYPPMLRRLPYPASVETRHEIEKHINELLDMDVIRKIGNNEIV
ncbi:hypothetical protein O181_015188 [Austropuccinia psidii MF-1]|uniref:Uncharacterized protein n=1 Tax=Austropuccinia psidii MF-1 TaxID=1389203 RepID=A0A9Q3C203_9BASI|nr:hypothetical protein [Austropuccinia psidii MF-1]